MAVIVGVDGSEASRRALMWAAREAVMRDERLVAVHAYASPVVYYPYGEFPGGPDSTVAEEARRLAQELLHKELETARDAFEGLEIQEKVVEDPQPARVLTTEAGPDELLVVGSRGRGGFRGLLLGSVSHQCTQHASCPVVVVRPES